MAPKKPPNKPGKKDPPPKKEPDKPEKDEATQNQVTAFQEKVKKFFESSYSLYIGAMLVLGSFLAASVLTYLYAIELQKRSNFKVAVSRIVTMVEENFPSERHGDDFTKLKKAENVSLTIAEGKKNIDQIKRAIDDVNQNLKHEWIMWRGALYLFDAIAATRPWRRCLDYCHSKKYETKLLCVESDAEQMFVVSTVRNKPIDYFVGMYLRDMDWICYDNRIRVQKYYWDKHQPSNSGPARNDTTNCVIINRGCGSGTFCWNDIHCNDRKRCVCKRKPLAKWMK